MGLGGSKTRSSSSISKTDALQYYETSTESWIFNQEHIKAIEKSLDKLSLEFCVNIILSYMGNINNKTVFKWNHPNYTAYIHPKRTPLKYDTSPLSKDWLDVMYRKGYGSEYNTLNIVMLGGGGVGKSSITIRLATDNFLEEYDPTIEDSYRKRMLLNVPKSHYDSQDFADSSKADNVLLDILDTAGREEFRYQYFQQANLCKLICDTESYPSDIYMFPHKPVTYV